MKKLIKIDKSIPLLGAVFIGIIDRGTNLLQVRPTTVCNLNCTFCSTDSGFSSKSHPVDFEVDVNHIVDWVKRVLRVKGECDILIDSVGNPFCYGHLTELIEELKKLNEIKSISTQGNGYFYNYKIKDLEKAGLDRINLSIMSFNAEKNKKLSGCADYDIKKVLDTIYEIKKSKIDLLITPVLIPKVNEEDIEEIITFCKKNEIKLGVQNYEIHKYGRKMKGVKKLGWWKFYDLLKRLEKKYDVKLKIGPNDFGIKKSERIPTLFEKGEKVNVRIIMKGWFEDQMIGLAKDRMISINKCYKTINSDAKVKILSNNDGIYTAEMTRV